MRQIKKTTLVLDAAKAKTNIARMKSKADAHGVLFRPHFKTHQSGLVGQWFRAAGVSAITVSSVDMAGYFAVHGWDDITIAFPLNIRQMDEINRLASRIRLTVIVDNLFQTTALTEKLQHPVNAMIELDVGHGRTGVAADDLGTVEALAASLTKSGKTNFSGFLTHAGQTYRAKGISAIEDIAATAYQRMAALRSKLGMEGLKLSWGDTPSCAMLPQLPPFDEWRPGNFVYFDVMQYHIGACRLEDVAVALYCPVVGVYRSRNQMVISGGAVHLSKDFIAADGGFSNYGYIVKPVEGGWGKPIAGAWLASLSQEHGVVNFLPGTPMPFAPGDLVGILPVHSCLTADAMGCLVTLDDETVPMFRSQYC
ncbi:MAG: alanine racemase [Bacteroidetes bacterium]|nr:alanine racemase [Bacteroidota bacterium]